MGSGETVNWLSVDEVGKFKCMWERWCWKEAHRSADIIEDLGRHINKHLTELQLAVSSIHQLFHMVRRSDQSDLLVQGSNIEGYVSMR